LINKIELDFISIIDSLSIIWEYNFSNENSLLKDIVDLLKIILNIKLDEKYIKIIWFNQSAWITLEYTLLNPWEYLLSNLYDNINSILLTSATLTIWGNFDYFKKLLALDKFEFTIFESDFDYKKQSTLFIPNDLWSIKNNTWNIVNFLNDFFLLVWWKTLTLLTSFNVIKKIYTSVNQNLKKHWINLYAQSIWWSKVKLLEFYLDSPSNSILLWTNSFWEWINIPWDNLKYLVIHKFPFQVPNDPIFQSRSKFFNDPFLDYSIPKAIIKLKQWFWRLIRSHSDTWIIILLDDRIFNTKWWKEFYKAFPDEINIKHWTSKWFLSILENKK
jgi:Rad3-related DNA helicase